MGAFRIEYSRFILAVVAVTRRFYLVVFALLVVALAATGLFLRQRALKTADAAANCETPALPPPPTTPPPKLPGFTVEAGCGTAPTPAKLPTPAPIKR
jgi:hypothetical protein